MTVGAAFDLDAAECDAAGWVVGITWAMAVGVKAAAAAFFRNVLRCKARAPELNRLENSLQCLKLYEGVIWGLAWLATSS